MKTAIFKALIIGLATVGLAGCAHEANQNPGDPPGPVVEINVDEGDNGAVTITVEPYELDLTGRRGQQRIRFRLTSDTFSFVQDASRAIDVRNGGGQFFGHTPGSGRKTITLDDRNDDGQTYHYTIRVVDDSNRRIELDPLIKNRQ